MPNSLARMFRTPEGVRMSPGKARVFGPNFTSLRTALNRAAMARQAMHNAVRNHQDLIRAQRAAEIHHIHMINAVRAAQQDERARENAVIKSTRRIHKLRNEYVKLARRAKRNRSANFKSGPLSNRELHQLRNLATEVKNRSALMRTMKRVNLPKNVKLKIISS